METFTTAMESDTVILEVRRLKQELQKRDNSDIAALFRNARAQRGRFRQNRWCADKLPNIYQFDIIKSSKRNTNDTKK